MPLDQAFTYDLNGLDAEVGARVLVPFGGQRLAGVVVRLHDEPPAPGIDVKRVDRLLDETALLSADLLELGRWIAQYYCAPVGEVLRGMLPVNAAEVRRRWVYRIAEAGRRVLAFAGPVLAFVTVSQWLGLYVATALYLTAVLRWQGKRSWATSLAVALGSMTGAYVVFERWFQVPLLKGPIEAWLSLA